MEYLYRSTFKLQFLIKTDTCNTMTWMTENLYPLHFAKRKYFLRLKESYGLEPGLNYHTTYDMYYNKVKSDIIGKRICIFVVLVDLMRSFCTD